MSMSTPLDASKNAPPMTGVRPAPILSRMLAELFGTFVLVFAVIGTALFLSPTAGVFPVAVVIGIAVMASAYAVGSISGGHFNPAVTVGAALARRMRWRDVGPYIAAQIGGGLAASTLLVAVSAGGPNGFLRRVRAAGFASNGWGTRSPEGFDLTSVLLVEAVLTGVFVAVILAVTAPQSTTAGFAPIAIGLTLTLCLLVAIPVSNASINPARSIATAVYGGPTALSQLWAFILAPFAGATLSGLACRYVWRRPRMRAGGW
jgi:aquaporin Z